MKTFKVSHVALPASAIFLTFILMGLWHDFTLTNLCYGVYHGAGLACFMVFTDRTRNTKAGAWMRSSWLWRGIAIIITIHFCFLSFLVFCGKFIPFIETLRIHNG